MSIFTRFAALALAGLTACDKGSPWPNYGGDFQARWEALTQTGSTVTSKWTTTTGQLRIARIQSCPTINRANEMVIALVNGDIVAINPTTHNIKGIDHVAEIVRGAVNIYEDRPLISVSGASGPTTNQVKSLGATTWSTPVIDLPSTPITNGDKVFVSANRFVYALDRSTGTLIHQTDVGDEIVSTAGPSIVPEADLSVVVATLDGHVIKLDPITGTIKWDIAIGGAHFNNGVSIALNGTIFVRSHEGLLFVIGPNGNLNPKHFNSGTGNTLGTRLLGPAVSTFGGTAVAYVADANRKLTAVSDKAAVLWQRDLPEVPVSEPVAAGDTVYVAVGGSPNTKLIAVTKDRVRWSADVGYPPCLAAGRDGYIYATAGGNILHMIKIG